MTAIASTDQDRATAFAAAVRERLSDLPAAELDELLDGLQADLAERLADGGELGDPGSYAEELRQAAGLPPRDERAARTRRDPRRAISEAAHAGAERFRRFWAATPARRGMRDLVLALRPIWWVARGLVGAWALLGILGHPAINGLFVSLPAILLAAILVLVSVQWGRGLWAPRPWLVWLRRVVNGLAVLLLLPALGVSWNALTAPRYIDVAEPDAMLGLARSGEQIENIFVYDCAGQPLSGVQLFDQDGRPITTLQGEANEGAEPVSGWDEATQRNIHYLRPDFVTLPGTWNVFPLREALIDPLAYAEDQQRQVERAARDATPPFAEVPALGSGCPAAAGADSGDADAAAAADETGAADGSGAVREQDAP